jgi:hypothetical protein
MIIDDQDYIDMLNDKITYQEGIIRNLQEKNDKLTNENKGKDSAITNLIADNQKLQRTILLLNNDITHIRNLNSSSNDAGHISYSRGNLGPGHT